MIKKIKKYIKYYLILCFIMYYCNNLYAAESSAKIGNNEYTWYNLPDGLTAQQPPSSEHIAETRSMKATVYGLYGDTDKGSCSGNIETSSAGYKYCTDQLGSSYMISPTFMEATERNIIPRVVAAAYSKNGNVYEIPRGTLIYIKSNVSGVEDYGYAIVGDTGGGVEKGELDLYMPYAKNNGDSAEEEKFNQGLDFRQYLKLGNSGNITVYITKYNIARDKYIYIAPKGTIVQNSPSPSSSTNQNSGIIINGTGLNSKIIYNTTKIVTTSGTRPFELTSSCKDAVEQYWSQTTSLSGDDYGESGNISGSGEIFVTVPGTEHLSKAENNQILNELFDGNIPVKSSQMNQWLTTIQVPYLDKNGNRQIRSLQVHKKLAQNFIGALTELADSGFKAYDLGTYCWRKVNNGSGSNTLSQHSYGVAIDINPAENYFPGVTSGLYKPGVNEYSVTEKEIAIMGKYGLRWGGGYEDYMHFSISGR